MSTTEQQNGGNLQNLASDDPMLMAMVSTVDVNSTDKIAVMAEDEQQDGIDYSLHFWSPQPGKSYTIKFLPLAEPGQQQAADKPFVNREIYKRLPDPQRKGKTFQTVVNGTNHPVMQLFFELNKLKKEGNNLADQKIDHFLSKTSEQCAKIQILSSPDKEEIGKIRLFVYSSAGQNATIAKLINIKTNPTEQQREQGYNREDIATLFGSPVMMVDCRKSSFENKITKEQQEGRDFSESTWALKQRGAILYRDGQDPYEFSKNDLIIEVVGEKEIVKGIKPESIPLVREFLNKLTHPDISVKEWFGYRDSEDTTLSKETREYAKIVEDKVTEIVEVIRNAGSIQEIKNYGKTDNSAPTGSEKKQGTDIYADSIPDELKDTVGQTASAPTQAQTPPAQTAPTAPAQTAPAPTPPASDDPMAVLG